MHDELKRLAEKEPATGYSDAFYQLGRMLGIPAQNASPAEVWETQMKPTIIAALTARSDGWRDIESAPHAMCVLATRFDAECGEWATQVVMSPPSYPFTHWQPLPTPPETTT